MSQDSADFLSRTLLLLGEQGVARLKSASVAVFGVGGVGSHAAEALVRAGLGAITLVDSDTVHPSNINRQVHALTNTVRQSKVSAMADRLRLINPDLKIYPLDILVTSENVPLLLSSGYDLVMDAIDTFSAKVSLLKYCHGAGIIAISSMGAAGRLDPARVRSGDISRSHGCRLGRKLRKALRHEGIFEGITVVYSEEPFCVASIGESDSEGSRRSMGTISYMPAIFGMTMAALAIASITGHDKKMHPPG